MRGVSVMQMWAHYDINVVLIKQSQQPWCERGMGRNEVIACSNSRRRIAHYQFKAASIGGRRKFTASTRMFTWTA